MQLARTFREQSALCLQQADLFDRMALSCDQGNEYSPELLKSMSRTPLEEKLRRKNVTTHVSESSRLMLDAHEKLDSIEKRLYPFRSKV